MDNTRASSSLRRKEAKKLRKQRLKVFRNEPVTDGNTLVDIATKPTLSVEEREEAMAKKLEKITKLIGG